MNTNASNKLFSIIALLVIALSMKIIHPAVASISTISIVALPSAAENIVYSATRVYQEPNDSSPVIDVLSPGTNFNILGYNGGGTFIAIAKPGQSLLSGWIPISQVARTYIGGTSQTLSIGYVSPSSTSITITVLTPGQKVSILGLSPDGNWLAIENPTSIRTPLYWIARSAISLPAVIVKTYSLTMVYAKPTTRSLITNVLDPTYQLILIGRTNNNAWYAAEDITSGKFIGWVRSGDLAGGANRSLLPEIDIK